MFITKSGLSRATQASMSPPLNASRLLRTSAMLAAVVACCVVIVSLRVARRNGSRSPGREHLSGEASTGESSALARRSAGRPDDDESVTHSQMRPDPAFGLLKLYDDALPHVYGYLLARCGDTGLAEDLTAESFLAAVHAVRKPGAADPSVPWLIGVARHKLADHWRRVEREQLALRYLDGLPVPEVARHLDRTLHATEALLVRARAAFRRIYEGEEGSR